MKVIKKIKPKKKIPKNINSDIIPYNPGEYEDYSEQTDEYWKQQEKEL